MAFKMKGFSGFKKEGDELKSTKQQGRKREARINTTMEQEAGKARKKNQQLKNDPYGGIDPDAFRAMLSGE